MIGLIVASILLAALTCVITLVQVLYMESLRLRTRELPMLEFFRTSLEDKIGIHDEKGALVFSIVKHTTQVLVTLMVVAARLDGKTPLWQSLLEAAGIAWLLMILSTYVVPHLLYRKTRGDWLLPLVPLLKALNVPARPLAALLAFFQSLVELAEPESVANEAANSAEHIDALIAAWNRGRHHRRR